MIKVLPVLRKNFPSFEKAILSAENNNMFEEWESK